MAAIRAMQAGEAGGQVAAAREGSDGGAGTVSQRAEGAAVAGFVFGEEVSPRVVDDLPEGRGTGPPRPIGGRYK